MMKIWAGVALSFLASGCAHYYLPSGALETPEVSGGERLGRVEFLSFQSGADLVGQPINSTEGLLAPEEYLNYVFGFTKSLSDHVDASVHFGPDSPLLVRLKYQWLGLTEDGGQGKVTTSWGDRLSLAIYGQGGLLLGRGDYGTASYHLEGAGLLGGLRFNDRHLIYAGPGFNAYGVSGVLAEARTGSQLNLSAGYQYTEEALFGRLEVSRVSGSINGNDPHGNETITGYFGSAMIGLNL